MSVTTRRYQTLLTSLGPLMPIGRFTSALRSAAPPAAIEPVKRAAGASVTTFAEKSAVVDTCTCSLKLPAKSALPAFSVRQFTVSGPPVAADGADVTRSACRSTRGGCVTVIGGETAVLSFSWSCSLT